MLYALKLGKDQKLSLKEIEAKFGQNHVIETVEEHALLKIGKDLTQADLDSLGGTIKMSQIKHKANEREVIDIIANEIAENAPETKITYAINIYPLTSSAKKTLKNILTGVKKALRRQDVKSRFMNKMPGAIAFNIENIQSIKEILKKDNALEFNLIKTGNEYYVSRLIASQDIEKYTRRDIKRPHRDTRNGMLPPKLSQILINLSIGAYKKAYKHLPEDPYIIDPFCGSGSLLMEAMLMGHNIQGSDISETMINHSKENLNWLIDRFKLDRKLNIRLFEHDAKERFPKAKKQAIIATEGYLGLPFSQFPTPAQIKENFDEIKDIYIEFFKNLTHMHDEVSVSICIPTYIKVDKNKRKPHTVSPELIPIIKDMGFNLEFEYLYFRANQTVARNIAVFTRLKK